MAFCPNCGTPNTEQAEKCVACGFEIAVPKQKAKFKGTIMMSGIKAPPVPDPRPPEEPPAVKAQTVPPPPPPAALSATGGGGSGRNLSYQKTILGPVAGLTPPPASFAPPPPGLTPPPPGITPPAPPPRSDSIPLPPSEPPRAATIHGQAPPHHQLSRPAPTPLPAPLPAALTTTRETPLAHTPAAHTPVPQFAPTQDPPPMSMAGASFGGTQQGTGGRTSFGAGVTGSNPSYGDPSLGAASTGGFASPGPGNTVAFSGPGTASTFPPSSAAARKPNPSKAVLIGCASLLALVCLLGSILYFAFGPKLRALLSSGGDASSDAAAWQSSISQALTQVAEICRGDCQSASIFFHPAMQQSLLGQAKALTPETVSKLSDPSQSESAMLDATDDTEMATKLGLDPQQCARVMVESAKVVSCSVPDPDGKPSLLRIVHLSGIDSL